MIGKKINQLATELAPVSTDLTIIGDPISGVSKKITLAQLGAIFSGAVSFYSNLAGFPAVGDINVIYCAKDTQKLYLWSGSAYVEVFPSQALLDTYQLRSEKGNANGYASLDSQGKVPISQLPSSIMEYKGTWNASTNTPTLANGTGDTGDVYICNVAGTVNFGAGPITFAVGDYVIYSGTIWQRSSGAVGTVTSVAASITGDSVTISGSPVTTSGTLAFAFAGTGAQYIKGDGTLATFPNTIDQAKNLITEVYNSTGATLTKGTVVYINGGQGNLPTVTKALASGDSTSAQTYGIVQADITNMNNGFVVVAGRLTDIDTQAYTNGTQLYLSSTTAGAYTSTKQYAPAHLVYIGIIVRSHPTQGVIEVKIQNGYELDELHNVAAQTPTNNDGLFWEASTSLWKNKSIATILGYTPQAQLNGTGFVKASGTTITYDNSTYLTTSAAATTYLPLVLSSTANVVDINGQQFNIWGSAGGYTSGRIIVDPVFSAIGYQNAGVFDGLKILTNGNAEFSNSGVTRFFNQVRFDSTLTNGTYTYTLPGATGTIALTTDIPSLTGYVPYTGATTNLNLGSNNLTAAAITGTSARITTLSGSVFADVNGNLGTTSGTQDTLTYWASQYSIASLSTSTYPSLTELSYVKGVTSSIQTQLNAKQNTLTNPVTGTGTTNYLPKFTGTSTIGNSLVTDNGYYVGFGFSGAGILGGQNLGVDSIGAFQNNLGSYGYRWLVNNGVNELMRLNASGNLSIGNTNDTYKLDVSGQGRFTGALSLGSNTNYILFGTDAAVNPYVQGGSDNSLYIGTGNASRLTIASTGAATFSSSVTATELYLSTSNGLVGNINSSNANGGYLTWQTSGAVIADIGTAQQIFGSGGNDTFGINGRGARAIAFGTNNTERMRISSSGNVGIGTTTPLQRLHVYNSASSSAAIFQGSSNSYIQLGVSNESYIGNVSGALLLETGGSERMRITSGGNVLIGASSIAAPYGSPKLFVVGGSTPLTLANGDGTGTYLQFNTGAANGVVNLQADARTGAYPDLTFTTGATERMRIKSNGIINLSNVPSSSAGLSSGDIYKTVAGVLMIV